MTKSPVRHKIYRVLLTFLMVIVRVETKFGSAVRNSIIKCSAVAKNRTPPHCVLYCIIPLFFCIAWTELCTVNDSIAPHRMNRICIMPI
jgi:hypothetical protein